MADETTESQNQSELAGVGGPDAGSQTSPAGDAPAVAAGEGGATAGSGDRPSHGRHGGGGGGRQFGGGRGRGGPRGRRDAGPGEDSGLDEVVVRVYRCATVVKGGRRFSFGALVVVGDRQSRVGIGYGKANEVPSAVDKARKAAQRNMISVKLEGTTIPHQVMAKYGASKVLLVPAGKGTGVIAGGSVRAVMELAGIKDVLTKAHGSTGPKNLVKAAFAGLAMLRQKDDVAKLREVSLA
ncbi:MAG: 30S ribosomal protein S5 [Phycisphaerae bacterium]|nr:30S ribosomal protein S5 [Phycisphaerae bacterium]